MLPINNKSFMAFPDSDIQTVVLTITREAINK